MERSLYAHSFYDPSLSLYMCVCECSIAWKGGGRLTDSSLVIVFVGDANEIAKYQIVLIRHGESQWNVDNRFTGWHDVPLSATGMC